ncbi:MAG: CDP-alcohol phosphatidyltransferase family protein [Pseudomonadota bacterium]
MSLSLLPNFISACRIALSPVLIFLLHERDYRMALIVFLVAGISDALDGFIARRWGFMSRTGAILDPLADKLLLVSAYVMLAFLDHLPFWLVLVVASRDALIVGGYLGYTSMYGPVHMRPSLMSKLNTLLQITLVLAVLAAEALAWPPAGWISPLVWAVLATTVASGLHYLWIWAVRKDIEHVHAEKRHD